MDEQADGKRQRRPDGTFAPKNSIGPRFPPGKSGNPKGEQPSIIRAFKRMLRDDPKLEAALAESLITNAAAGSVQHLKLAIEYLDGKVPEILHVKEHVIELLPPGVARGHFEIDDDDADTDSPGGIDDETASRPE